MTSVGWFVARGSSWFGSEDDPSSGKNHLSIHEPLHEEEEDAPPKGPAGAGACCEAGRSIGGGKQGFVGRWMVRERNFPHDLRRGLGTVSNFPRWYITGSTHPHSLPYAVLYLSG